MLRSATEKLHVFLQRRRVGYFSMEIALRSEIPTYAGGLGVLAGDTLRSAADLGVPLVGVTLVSREGYFRQSFDVAGRQVEQPDPWEPAAWAEPLPAKASVAIDGRHVWIGGWLYVVEGAGGGRVPVVLLDCDLPENAPQDRRITHALYGGDREYRLAQEIVLGIGGVRMLEALGFGIDAYHLNEGHSVLLALELLRRSEYEERRTGARGRPFTMCRVYAPNATSRRTLPSTRVTTDFRMTLFVVCGRLRRRATLRRLGGDGELNTTRLAMNSERARQRRGASPRGDRGEALSRLSRTAITNESIPNLAHPAVARMFDRFCQGWAVEPEPASLRADSRIPNEEIARGQAAKLRAR